MPKQSQWWRSGGMSINRGNLNEHVPVPDSTQGHVLSDLPSSKGGDDWRLIRELAEFGGPMSEPILIEQRCVACSVSHEMVVARALLKEVRGPFSLKWLCGECQDTGFEWASNLPLHELQQHQIVKAFKDDTLVRHLRFSPNRKDGEHSPVDSVERTVRQSLTRKKKRRIF